MITPDQTVFLVDVDNTLLDNDRIQADLKRHLEREFGAACRDRYWAILEQLFSELGYRDYLGALQRYRVEHPSDIHLLSMSSYLVDYPFANRLYPGSARRSRAFPRLGADRHPVRRRRRLSAAQGRALRDRRGGRRQCADLYPQGGRARRRRAALPGRAITFWSTTSRGSWPRSKRSGATG